MSLILLEKLKTLFVAEETVPGTCEETGLTAVGVFDLQYTPEFETTAQNLTLGTLGVPRYFKNCRRPLFTFKTHIRGSGTGVDDPPQEAPLYKAAGMVENITPATSVAYTFSSLKSDWEWLTVHFYYGDSGVNDYIIMACGCLLTGVMRWEPCQPGVIDWRCEGVFREILTAKDFYGKTTAQSFNPATIATPAAPTCQNGSCIQIDSVDLVSNMFELDMGNIINPRPVLGCKRHGHEIPYFSDRQPRGTIQCEIPDPDNEFDMQAAIIDDTIHTIAFTCGTTATNRYSVAGEAQFLNITENPNDGITGWNCEFGLVDEADQEFSLIFT